MLDINPTLLIGLGGSGREILLRIRRRFIEAGFFEPPAWISFLWIDTAASSESARSVLLPDGHEQPLDHLASRTFLRDHEFCDLGISQTDLATILDPNNADRNKHIFEWLDPSSLPPIDAHGLTLGARKCPQLARLALFARAPHVIKKIGGALRSLHQSKIIANLESALTRAVMPRPAGGEQFEVYNECQTIVLGSLAGGTGAGICVDVAAILKSARTLFQFETRMAVWGHFLLPDIFIHDPNISNKSGLDPLNMRANSRAALEAIERVALPRSSAFKGTWLFSDAPDRAPEIPAPLYDAAVLYDGSHSDAAALNYAGATAQIAHLIFNEVRIKPAGIPGLPVYGWMTSRHKILGTHRELTGTGTDTKTFEKIPPYSMRFAACGYARATLEVPRLRFMAALTLAAQAMQNWLGDPEARSGFDQLVKTVPPGTRSENLKLCILSRLEQEFSTRVAVENRRWRDALPDDNPCMAIATLRNSIAISDRPDFFESYFRLADKWPVSWKPDELGERLLRYYFTGSAPRIRTILRELAEMPPLDDWNPKGIETPYSRPGGIWAVDYVLSPSSDNPSRTILEAALSKCVTQLAKKAVAYASHNAQSREALQMMSARYGKLIDECKRSKNQFWTRKTTLDRLEQDRMSSYFELQAATLKWLENVQKQKVCEALKYGFESMARRTGPIQAALSSWRNRIQSIRSLLLKLLDNPTANDSNPQFGVKQILAQFRQQKADASTLHLRADLQQDTVKLAAEILAAYTGSMSALNESVAAIQDGMRAVWRELLFDPNGTNTGLPPHCIDNIMDLTDHAAFERMPFAEQIDYMAALGLAQKGAQDLLKKSTIRDALLRDTSLGKNLDSLSACRLTRRTKPRRNPTGLGIDSDSADFKERALFMGPQDAKPNADFLSAGSPYQYEAVCLRFDYFFPLPSLACWTTTDPSAPAAPKG